MHPRRATSWKLKSQTLHFSQRPAIMGILNVTPDSFSDGGRHFALAKAVEVGERMADEGADILDVGGESTRPFAEPVAEREELRRVVDVVQQLATRVAIPISIDTSKPKVAAEALAAGAQIINDVTGLTDPAMRELAAATEAGVCAMHMHGTPQTMQVAPESHYQNVVTDIRQYLQARHAELMQAGIERERICLDPGIGFGKTHQHNLTLLREIGSFHALGAPLLVGHSRKGFLAKVIGDADADRTYATLGVSLALAGQGVQVLRVHDVLPTRQALVSFAAAQEINGPPPGPDPSPNL